MVQSNIHNPEASLEMEENSGCKFTEQGDTNNTFKMNGIDQVRDLIRNGDWATNLDLKSAFHHLIVYPPHRPYLAFEAMGKVYQYRTMPFGTLHSPIFFAQALAMVLTKILRESDIRILNYVDDLLLLHQNKERLIEQTQTIMKILDAFGWSIAQEKCETEPQQQINFLRWTWDLKRKYVELSQSPSKRSIPPLKANGLSKNVSLEEQRMEREYDSTQRNTSRALLVVGSDSEELRDDIKIENSRGSNRIRRISEKLESDSGTTNRGQFSPTWRMDHATEILDKQQERDGSHILRAIPLRINLQSAADQGDPHQIRQHYLSIRFSKTKSRINSGSRREENSQSMSITENTNQDSTYFRSIKQDNRRTKQVKYPGRLFSKERDIHSPVLSMGDITNTGLARNRGKQTRGQIRGNRRAIERGKMAERISQTLEGGNLLDSPTNSEDWESPDRLGKVETKVNHDSTLVARSNMVYTLTKRQQQIPYS
ncbi:MAG: putative Transposon Ty3-G Gag-Pol polyprotein [Streblomastix strix]|uniref:Putative Transposon Ty3-G Gag-Pol polyprotein n=1 Tax=Streblomastix strix TaxID=222440 RepID=A0A5J4VZZ0_9EUKA|nr:MAG: putative Transposon Ty3-G Gag-Pol polyprotein [Streblomastix strix]